MISNKMWERLSQLMKPSSYIFKENHVFIEEVGNPSDKVGGGAGVGGGGGGVVCK